MTVGRQHLPTKKSPGKIFERILQLPTWLYRRRMGWLLGHSFLLITHTGRISGHAYQTVVKTVRYEPTQGTYIVTTAWGETSKWLQNIQNNPEISIQVGGRTFSATATQLSIKEAQEILKIYAQRHPASFRSLTTIVTGTPVQTDIHGYQLLAQRLPLVMVRLAQVPYRFNLQESS